jgi:hypothetical protein
VVYNLLTESVLMTINVGKVGDTSEFIFTDDRKLSGETPVFAAGAAAEVAATAKSSFVLRIPQASVTDYVNNYRVEVYQGSNKIDTIYRLACQYLGTAAPACITAPVTGLTPNTTYTVKVYAVSNWGKESTPLTLTVKTASQSLDLTPDVFSLGFDAQGNVINLVDGSKLNQHGTASVVTDTTLGQSVISTGGSGCYTYAGMTDYYDLMASGFTFETYIYLESKSAPAGYFDTVSNQESGGFGFEVKSNGQILFMCHSGSGYDRVGTDVQEKQWMHLVGVYDGSKLHLYANGKLIGSANAHSGSMTFPAAYAQYLCLGGDSGSTPEGTSYMNGKIAVTNIYSEALSASEVLAIYNANK